MGQPPAAQARAGFHWEGPLSAFSWCRIHVPPGHVKGVLGDVLEPGEPGNFQG